MTVSENRPYNPETLVLRIGLLALTVGIWRSANALWGSGDFIRQPVSVILALVLCLAAFGIVVLASLKNLSYKSIWVFPVGLALIFAGTIQVETVSNLQSGQSTNTDVFALTDYGANLILMGKNPYAYDYADYQNIYRMTRTFSTPLLSGNYISASIDYPALALVLPLPFLLLKIPTMWIYPLFLALTLAAVLIAAPRLVRPIILAPLLIDSSYIFYSFGGVSDIVWAFFACMTVIAWRRRWQSAIWFGLACAAKQQPWLLAPFLLIRIWQESENLTQRERLREVVRYAAIALAVFLVINAPFIVTAPGAWLNGVLVPFQASMVTLGQGIASLTMQGMVNVPKIVNTSFVVLVILLGLFVYWRHFWKIRPLMWIIPSIAFWFGQRSLASYWYYNLIPLVLDLAGVYLREPPGPRVEKAVRWLPTALATGGTAALIIGSLAWFGVQPPPISITVQRPITVQGVAVSDLVVYVTNPGTRDLNPRFSVQSWTEQPQFWSIETGPSLLKAGDSAFYRIRAANTQTAFNYGFGAQVIVSDANDYFMRASEVLKGDVEQNFLDGIPNGSFEYWNVGSNTPLAWGVITSGARTATSFELAQDEQLKYVARLSLADAAGSDYASVMLDTWLNLPVVPITLWVKPPPEANQPGDLNLIYGFEIRSTFNDQAVWVLFGDQPGSGQIRDGLPYVMLPAPRDQWSQQTLDVRAILAQAGVDLAPPEWVNFHTEIDYPKQMVNFRLLLAARNQPPGAIQADFGPVHAAAYQPTPVDLIRESLDHPDYALVAHGDFVRRNYSYDEARRYYEDALKLNPDSAEAHYGLAEIALHEGQWDVAIADYNAAIDSGVAARALVESGLAWASYQKGDDATAQTHIEDAVRRLEQTPFLFDNVESATTYARLGWIAYRQARYTLAQRAFQRAGQLDGSNADAAFGQGVIALRAQAYADAVRALNLGIQLGFPDPGTALAREIVSLNRCDDLTFYTETLNLAMPANTCQNS